MKNDFPIFIVLPKHKRPKRTILGSTAMKQDTMLHSSDKCYGATHKTIVGVCQNLFALGMVIATGRMTFEGIYVAFISGWSRCTVYHSSAI